METCNVETGLLKKKPCGEKAVTHCANCEQALCSKHAVAQMSGGKKTFLCQECAKAWKQSEKTVGTLPPTPAPAPAKKPAAEAPKPAAAAPAPKPVAPAPAPKPVAAAPAPKPAPAAPKPAAAAAPKPPAAAPKPAPAEPALKPVAAPTPAPVPPAADSGLEKKSEPPKEDSGPLEFTLEPMEPKDKK